LFGIQALHLFVIACAISYMLSGNSSLYHEQLLPNKKLKLGGLSLPKEDTDSAA